MDKEAKKAPKLEYHAPRLERYGTLSELTQTGQPGTGDDFIFGSVHPPGHDKVDPPGPPGRSR